jgi:hypothetical protein
MEVMTMVMERQILEIMIVTLERREHVPRDHLLAV